ncbi:MAG: YvcK family protein [Candidatus Nealsonbacteria bacterium]|nr:YvcK family protein [Candidatus Nealsonbacteria bacterium]
MSIKSKKIVCLGGGTGLSVVLSGLKKHPFDLAAVVTMFDNGGSSGKLRKELGVLPPGDLRQCLTSLSPEKDLASFFNYRFKNGTLKGHSLGNLLIAAAEQATGNIEEALGKIAILLKVKEKIIPATLDKAEIRIILNNGKEIIGEEEIINYPISSFGVKKIYLKPAAKANPKAILAIKEADLLVIGPGKFYTSIIPILLAKGIKGAILRSSAKKIFICNLTTQSGNTDGFKVEDFTLKLEECLGKNIIDYVIFNTGGLAKDLIREVQKVFPGAEIVQYGPELLKDKKFIGTDLLDRQIKKQNPADILVKGANKRTMLFHDADKLAKIILNLCKL